MDGSLYDPGLHLFLDDEEIQDQPGFVRKVQRPERAQIEPVLRPERPWEGRTVQIKGGVLYDEDEDLFKMWYWTWGCTIDELQEGAPTFLCSCNALESTDAIDCPITWGTEQRDPTPFVGKKIRLHIQADNATSLFSYRFGAG